MGAAVNADPLGGLPEDDDTIVGGVYPEVFEVVTSSPSWDVVVFGLDPLTALLSCFGAVPGLTPLLSEVDRVGAVALFDFSFLPRFRDAPPASAAFAPAAFTGELARDDL